MQTVPITNDASLRFNTTLGGQTVTIESRYSPASLGWHFTITLSDGTAVVSGARMQSGVRLLLNIPSDFSGDLVALPLTKPDAPLGRNPWGNTHRLVYFTDEEIVELNLEVI